MPRRTVRMRLTLVYGGLFLLSGACLLVITYALVVHATSAVVFDGQDAGQFVGRAGNDAQAGSRVFRLPEGLSPQQAAAQVEQVRNLAQRQHDAELGQLLSQSAIALAIMSALSILLGWIMAGRVLRPLRTITRNARAISATNLHERLALDGPDDELKELGNTFDDLLSRLEASFNAQRQFIANASHELRTPLARQRTLVQVAITDPEADTESLRAAHERVLAANTQQERLIESLLTLARSEAGLDHREPFDLADVADQVVRAHATDADGRGLRLETRLDPACVSGAPRLVERLLTNLVANALRYNVPGGDVSVTTSSSDGHAVLTVTNTGPVVPEAEVARLFQPFQRAGATRAGADGGLGLGLSIVKAVAVAHGAALDARPRPDGGLRIIVSFPSPS